MGYLLEVEVLVFGIIVDGVVLLVVQPQASRVLGSSLVAHGLQEVLALIHYYLVGLGGIVLILQVEFVSGEGLDGKIGGQNGAVLGHDVGGLGHVA